ncbi:MAG: restriction endonuclease [Candidatus Saccharibacteria bacterium]|nr:restriction endonuclease [Candidatus Saccharibacteria bacterium]
MIDRIKDNKVRSEFNAINYNYRTIKPDGGIIILRHRLKKRPDKIVLISEIKRQGTNDARIKEGKDLQAEGNAIERFGKNLTGIRAMFNHEKITPFVLFAWGCDFSDNEKLNVSRLSMMNEFYSLNRIYVHKIDGNANNNFYAPITMYHRNDMWTEQEMLPILKEVAETSIRYYLF